MYSYVEAEHTNPGASFAESRSGSLLTVQWYYQAMEEVAKVWQKSGMADCEALAAMIIQAFL